MEVWINEVLLALIIAIAIGGFGLLRKLERTIYNGLTERLEKAEEWILWLIHDRLAERNNHTPPDPPEGIE